MPFVVERHGRAQDTINIDQSRVMKLKLALMEKLLDFLGLICMSLL